ncbi:hypothetical protein ACWDA3_25945 [Nonomuraea rubra]
MIHQATDRPPLPEPLRRLQQRYRGWSIWVSTPYPGRPANCYATRLQRYLTWAQLGAGLCMTVFAPDADGLAAKLAEQEVQL